jgi:hypothetical protein
MGHQDFEQDGTQERVTQEPETLSEERLYELDELETKLKNANQLYNIKKNNIIETHKVESLNILKLLYDNYMRIDDEGIVDFLIKWEDIINVHYENIKANVNTNNNSSSSTKSKSKSEEEYDEEHMRYFGGKRKAKSKKNNVSKKPVVSQKKQSEYKEILGKKMKIYKKPDSRKQYVRYKGELHSISDYKNLMKQKAAAKAAAKSKK